MRAFSFRSLTFLNPIEPLPQVLHLCLPNVLRMRNCDASTCLLDLPNGCHCWISPALFSLDRWDVWLHSPSEWKLVPIGLWMVEKNGLNFNSMFRTLKFPVCGCKCVIFPFYNNNRSMSKLLLVYKLYRLLLARTLWFG